MTVTSNPTATAGRRLIPSSEYKRVMGDISEMTRWRNEKAGIGPMPVRRGGRNFYIENEVLAYLDELAASRHANGYDAAGEGETEECLAERIAATCMTEGAKGD